MAFSILTLVLILSLVLIALGLPGLWVMIASAVVYNITTHTEAIGWVTLVGVAILALIAGGENQHGNVVARFAHRLADGVATHPGKHEVEDDQIDLGFILTNEGQPRRTFADLGQTLAENFGVGPLAHGTSFLEKIVAPPHGGHYGNDVQHS